METATHATTCPLDCPDTCSLEVTTAAGRIVSIAEKDEKNGGFICGKVRRFSARVHGSARVLYPMRRVGAKGSGQFERISWPEAIDEIAGRVTRIRDRWGGEAILPYHYGGSNGMMTDGLVDSLFFARLGASRLARTLCAAHTTAIAAAMYGKMPGIAFEDYADARFILVWGANPRGSNIHLIPFLRQARRRGAFVAAVDPIRNLSSEEVDLHVPVYPGADLPVALAMIGFWKERGLLDGRFLAAHATHLEPLLEAAGRWSIERAASAARLEAAEIRRLALVYAESNPAALRVGWGLERNRNGGRAIAALLAMPALLGKFGVRGGGYTLSNSGAVRVDRSAVLGDVPWTTRELNMTELGRLLDPAFAPPVKALFVYNCNPAVTVPDQNAVLRGFEREDLFTVVHEQAMTDTALYADVLLPATTFLEHYDLRAGYGRYVLGGVRPALEPIGEARPNYELFAMLGRALGFEDEAFHLDGPALFRRLCDAVTLAGRPAEPRVLLEGGAQPYDFPGERPVQFETVFPQTPDGKVDLAPAVLGARLYGFTPVDDARYPLALVSPASAHLVTSSMGETNLPELRITLHPDDAAARGLGDGVTARAWNDLGEVLCRVRVDARIRPGVVAIPKGAWRKSSRNGATSTALCPATVSEVAGAACYNDARVEVAFAPA